MIKGRTFTVAAGVAVIFLCAVATWHYRAVVKGNLVALLDSPYTWKAASTLGMPVETRLVAHAGGAVQGRTYTNSREALDLHYAAGYRVFELDFHWTRDGGLVVVHDWVTTSKQFGVPTHIFSYEEFVTRRRNDGLHQMTFEDLRDWLQMHHDAFVVTDTKGSNTAFLKYLQANGGDIRPQLIIQIYRISELQLARQLQPRAVWLTVYRYTYPAWALSRISSVDGFVIPVEQYNKYRTQILMNRIHFYVHSVPARSVDQVFRQLPGIYGIYVD